MVKCVIVVFVQIEVVVLVIGIVEIVCEGRFYLISDINKVYIGMVDGILVGFLLGSSGGGVFLDQIEILEVFNEIRIVIIFNGIVFVLSKVSDGVFEIFILGNIRVKGYYVMSLLSIMYFGSNILCFCILDVGGKSLYGIYLVY